MLVRAAPCPDHIRWRVRGMLGLWQTLDAETAADACQMQLQALLDYLDTVDGAQSLRVVTGPRVEIPVRLKEIVSYDQGP